MINFESKGVINYYNFRHLYTKYHLFYYFLAYLTFLVVVGWENYDNYRPNIPKLNHSIKAHDLVRCLPHLSRIPIADKMFMSLDWEHIYISYKNLEIGLEHSKSINLDFRDRNLWIYNSKERNLRRHHLDYWISIIYCWV